MSLHGKTAFVTGAGSGIGQATAMAFAQAGAWVLLVDRDESALAGALATLRQGGGQGATMVCDVRQGDAVRAAVACAVQQRGALDCAVNAAGVEGASKTLLDEDEALFEQVMDINLRGVWHCLRAQIGQMLGQRAGGAIVNIASAAGLVGSRRCAVYSASKHGVLGLTRSAALQYGGQRVRINAICPAGVSTDMARRIVSSSGQDMAGGGRNYPLGRYGTPQEIASGALWLCSEGAASTTGAVLSMDCGFTAA
ncbi:SDR family oxidoreductase [Verminephrobacter eiseniae]|uniref:SDR family oxidoreductase n=1 Tax=Verminephrobacter eiseniae TaxID=364317 RepID=UPI002238C8A9|nr:SDR family oxidoreductase [Verminephrobacter eiseniae]MCW5238380.1 SDR family oxidoreductase [Verminephrobacter eiseniae]